MAGTVLLLDAVPRVTAELARNLLQEAGIPALLHGPDFDVAEFGAYAHDTLRGVGVLVAARRFEEACAVLDEAWGRAWREKEAGPLVGREREVTQAAEGSPESDEPPEDDPCVLRLLGPAALLLHLFG